MIDFIRLTMPDTSPIVVPTKDVARVIPRPFGGAFVHCYKQESFSVLETPAEIGEMLGAACAAPEATEESTQARMHFRVYEVNILANASPDYVAAYLRQSGATVEWPEGDVS
jgi:hypothetical protein